MTATSERSMTILAAITPALEAHRRQHGYYPPLKVVRTIISTKYGDKAANTLYHNGLGALIQQHAAPLYSAAGARQFAAVARKPQRQPLRRFDWFGAHPSPFLTALDWLYWKLERAAVGDVIPVRADLHITRTGESAFRIRHGNHNAKKTLTLPGIDYQHALARLLIALLFSEVADKPVRAQHEVGQFGSLQAV